MKKLTALFLALALCLSLCTVTAFAGTISTIADVLATVEDFPTYQGSIPANAWTDGNGKQVFILGGASLYFIFDDDPGSGFAINKEVNLESNNYVYTDTFGNYTITFHMKNNVLTSVNFEGTNGFEKYNGTYTKPVTIADVLATVDGGFPTTTTSTPPANAWTDGNGKKAYVDNTGFLIIGTYNVNSTCDVKSEGDNYVYESSVLTGQYAYTVEVTFYMENDVLTSVGCVATGYFEAATGTYTAPFAITNGTSVDNKETNHGYISIDKETAAEGETVTVTVTADEGYALKTLKYNDGTDHDITKDATTGEYQFTMPAANVTVTAEFELIEEEPEKPVRRHKNTTTVTIGGNKEETKAEEVKEEENPDTGAPAMNFGAIAVVLGAAFVLSKKH